MEVIVIYARGVLAGVAAIFTVLLVPGLIRALWWSHEESNRVRCDRRRLL